MTSIITQYAIEAIDRVQNYPHIVEYIRSFDTDGGYTYKNDDEERERKILKREMDAILDNGKHTGPSTWEYMTSLIRLVISNEMSGEELIKIKARQENDEANLNSTIKKIWLRNEEIKKEEKFEIIKHAIMLQKKAEEIMQRSNNSPSTTSEDVIEELKVVVQGFHNATNIKKTSDDKTITLLKKELIEVLKSIQASKEIALGSFYLKGKEYSEEIYEQIVNETLRSAEEKTPEFLRAVMLAAPNSIHAIIRTPPGTINAIMQQEQQAAAIIQEEAPPAVMQQEQLEAPVEKKVKESKVKEPKVKEPKEPKVKEPKVKEAKEAKEPKVKEPKEPKVKEPKVKEAKVAKEPKVKEPKVKEPKVKEPKVKEPKVKEPKVAKVKEPKVKEPKEAKE